MISMRRLGASLVVALAALAFTAAPGAAARSLAFTDLGGLGFEYEARGAGAIERDCAFSLRLPSERDRLLWLFCDTVVRPKTKEAYLLGSSAATGPIVRGRAPDALRELALVPGQDGPSWFLPPPVGLPRLGQGACELRFQYYPAPWPTGAVRTPGSATVLVPYVSHCVERLARLPLTPGRFGVAEYDPRVNAITSDTPAVFARTPLGELHDLGSPIVRRRALYFFSALCDRHEYSVCIRGRVAVARVALGRDPARTKPWTIAARYRFWNGRRFATRRKQAVRSVVPKAGPWDVTVVDDRARRRLVLIETRGVDGRIRIWTSRSALGPWRVRGSGQLPNCPVNHSRPLDFCRAVAVHPELSTPRRLVISYYQPRRYRMRFASTRP
jgi:hypothetical protein